MIGHGNYKWTKEEEDALLAGIAKHGPGNWMVILEDPDFAAQLIRRTNISLKDKWRTLKNRVTQMKEEPNTGALKSAYISVSPAKTSSQIVSNVPSPCSSSDMSNESWCSAMVFEAISTINDEKGSDLSEILRFIEERHMVPQNYRKLLSNILRLLVSQDKLEKLRNRYKISTRKATKDFMVSTTSEETQEIGSAVEAAANKEPKQIKEAAEEINVLSGMAGRTTELREFVSEILTVLISQGKLKKNLNRHKISELEKKLFEVAPEIVAAKLAESDNKSLIAAEAVKEAQQMQKLAEESQLMLELCLEIHEECAWERGSSTVKSFSS